MTELCMSFDFGLKKIGVAVGQDITKTASPVAILRANDGIPNWQELVALVKKWGPKIFIVGLPLNLDGSCSVMSSLALDFANTLKPAFFKIAKSTNALKSFFVILGSIS